MSARMLTRAACSSCGADKPLTLGRCEECSTPVALAKARVEKLENAVEALCGLLGKEWTAKVLLGPDTSCEIKFMGGFTREHFAALRSYLSNLERSWPTVPRVDLRTQVMAAVEKVARRPHPVEPAAPAPAEPAPAPATVTEGAGW